MGQTATNRPVSIGGYRKGELAGDVRHEFVNGALFEMVGSGKAENTIAGDLSVPLRSRLRGSACRVCVGDVAVHVQKGQDDCFYHPDLGVGCTPHEPDAYCTETLPLIAEVLSASAQLHDRADKFYHDPELDSLQEYLPVTQDPMRVEIYRRASVWDLGIFDEADRFHLETAESELAAEELCSGVDWGQAE